MWLILKKQMRVFKFFLVIILLLLGLYIYVDKFVIKLGPVEKENQPAQAENPKTTEVIATNLNIPWEIAFLPSGEMLVTERGGKLLKLSNSAKKIISEIYGVKHIGEGGLLGLTLDPNFKLNKFIYLYSTTDQKGELSNRVERYKLNGDKLDERELLLDGIKGSSTHDGGRLAFGPDRNLYITTGDAGNPNSAQDKNSLNGKVLRIKSNGSIPEDNPFNNAVYSFGHRNPQGITWDKDGNLWITEHGPSGNDEINLIVNGGNYGWPEIKGMLTKDGMISPVIESGKNDTWAPAGLTHKDGYLFFAGLRSQTLYQAKIGSNNSLTLQSSLKNEFGRLRSVVVGPDGNLYLATSNTDGRGIAKEGDDKIIKIIK